LRDWKVKDAEIEEHFVRCCQLFFAVNVAFRSLAHVCEAVIRRSELKWWCFHREFGVSALALGRQLVTRHPYTSWFVPLLLSVSLVRKLRVLYSSELEGL
jgi:hypothetical protein